MISWTGLNAPFGTRCFLTSVALMLPARRHACFNAPYGGYSNGYWKMSYVILGLIFQCLKAGR